MACSSGLIQIGFRFAAGANMEPTASFEVSLALETILEWVESWTIKLSLLYDQLLRVSWVAHDACTACIIPFYMIKP